ncbi:MAG: response regulator [Magnetococcus sp. WYHC-3]
MLPETPCILVVDDEPHNLDIIEDYLSDGNYQIVTAGDGSAALTLLEQEPERFDLVLLDRMMPGLEGLEVLARIKAHPQLKSLPVILQTARAGQEDIVAGIEAGAYYYLTKPFEEKMLFSVVGAALRDRRLQLQMRQEVQELNHTLGFLQRGEFAIRTLSEARSLSTLLSMAFPDPARVVMGLVELLINAVEHGNLGIDYQEKTRLIDANAWLEEVERRTNLAVHAGKHVKVAFERSLHAIQVRIEDQGPGFDWQKYLKLSPDRALDSHGRGIAMAGMFSFDTLEYLGNGNTVVVTNFLNHA